MGTFAVAVSRIETATLTVVAENVESAERIALVEAEGVLWEPETTSYQVDDVVERIAS